MQTYEFLTVFEEAIGQARKAQWDAAKDIEQQFGEQRKKIAAQLAPGEGFLPVGLRLRAETIYPTLAWRRFIKMQKGAKPLARDFKKPRGVWKYNLQELQRGVPDVFHELIAETERKAAEIRLSVLLANDLTRVLQVHTRRSKTK